MPKWTREQLEAIEKSGSNIIVSAGAGSGKTAVLSERVIYKLQQGIHIGELLILTFTRAAAEEMKDRIRKKMRDNPAFIDEVNALDSAYITTFDSFALSVVKKYHYLLNIPKNIGISDESIVKIQKKKFLDETFDEYYEKEDERFSDFIKRYCIKSDDQLRNSVRSLADKIENYIDSDGYLEKIKNEFFEEANIKNILEEYKKFIDEKKKTVSMELENVSHYFEEDYILKLQNLILPILNTENLEKLCEYTNVKLPMVPRGTDEEAKTVKNRLKSALDDLLDYTKFGDEIKIRENILSTKDTVDIIIEIIKKYYEKLNTYKSENGIYTFQDIAMLAIRILKTNEDARLELKNTFKEIMIDEYQDTNDIQETFIGIIANNNVYMVGDIKQSIYRFRGSNPNIFKEKYDSYSENINGYKIDLIKNFRSREEVLNNINRIFDLIMDNDLGGAEYYESHEMVFGNTAYNEEKFADFNYDFEVLEYKNEKNSEYSNSEVEIFTIATDIKNKMKNGLQVFDKETSKLRPATYSDFVIILDRSTFFDDFKKIFEYMDIPLTILKDGKLNSSSDILIIKNIVDLIIRIKSKDFGIDFKYDFLSIGRSFLYEYTDAYLFEVITENRYQETSLYKDFENIENFNSKTSYELFEEILDITKFYSKLNKIGDYENINVRISTIADLASNLGEIGLDIIDFRDYLDEIISSDYEIKYTAFAGNSDSVKILTIHKSKGLEYPICYFADLDHKFNISDIKNKFICDQKYGIITPTSDEDNNESVIKTLYKSEYIKEEISEKIRLFYVALTRAREKMIIVLPESDINKLEKNENGTIELIRRLNFLKLSDFIYACKAYLPNYFKKLEINNINLTKNYLYNKPLNKIKQEEIIDEFDVEEIEIPYEYLEESQFSKSLPELVTKESKQNMEFGTTIHEILEYTDFENFDSSTIESDFIRSKIEKFVNNKLLKDIKKANIFREYEFIYSDDKTKYHGVIDLLLEYDDHIDIIDYKLKNTIDEHYKDQLSGYKRYIESISDKPTKTYLYSIIDGEFREI